MIERVLIYRLGSIGDTVVALPSIRLVASTFSQSRRILLTVLPRSQEAAPQMILKGMGLVDEFMAYNPGERNIRNLFTVRESIRAYRPDLLIYMNESRGDAKDLRDVLFFSACGVRKIVGTPLRRDTRQHRFDPSIRLFESEAHRIARSLSSLGKARVEDLASWDLNLSLAERTEADAHLRDWPGAVRFATMCVGSKIAVKDWGEPAWRAAAEQLGKRFPDLGLVFIGGREDYERSQRVAACWSGPTINLCGSLSPRVSTAVLANAELFIGNDGGPMHLASTVNTPCVVVFGDYNKPGTWYPMGMHHQVIQEKSLSAIAVGRVVDAAMNVLIRKQGISQRLNRIDRDRRDELQA